MSMTAIERQNRSGSEPERLYTAIERGAIVPLAAKEHNSLCHYTNSSSGTLFISAAEMLLQKIVISPLIGKLIERDRTGQIFGPPESGKSFIALDMGLCVATGEAWNGHHCEHGTVLYFAGEGHKGLSRRVKAWHQAHKQSDVLNFHSSRSTITFDARGLEGVVSEGLALQEQTGQTISLIIIDTLARHIQGDENSTQNMSEFVQMVDKLRNTFPGCTAIIVHHTGNDSDAVRSRGSSALKAACDFEIHCNKGTLKFTKMKDGEKPAPIGFELLPIEVGIDEDGEPITSCTVQYNEHTAKTGEVALTAIEQILMGLVDDYPELSSDALKTVFFDKRKEEKPEPSQETLKKSFKRSLDGLIKKGKVFIDGEMVKSGQGTLSGHLRDMSSETEEQEVGTYRDTPLKGCPDVPSSDCLSESAFDAFDEQIPEFDWED